MALPTGAHFEVVTVMLAARRGELTDDEVVNQLAPLFEQAESASEHFGLMIALGDLAAGGAVIAAEALGTTADEIVQRGAAKFARDD